MWYIAGQEDNVPEQMSVTINGTATIANEDANAALTPDWAEWIIPLQDIADQGVNIASVNMTIVGFGDGPPGGAGMVIFDDIRLYRPE